MTTFETGALTYHATLTEQFRIACLFPVAIYQHVVSRISCHSNQFRQNVFVKRFFRKNRSNLNAVNITDISTGHSLAIANDLLEMLAGQFFTVVDLGCGTATLSQLNACKEINYIGIDLVQENSAHDSTRKFIEAEIDGSLLLHGVEGPVVFFSSNFLCYLLEIDPFLDFLERNSRKGDLLVVIEPVNWIFWETFFEGIKINIRNSKLLSLQIEEQGWLRQVRGAKYYSLLGRGTWSRMLEIGVFKRL